MKGAGGVDLKAALAMGATGALGRIHESGSSAARRNLGRIDDERLEVTMREELEP